MRVSVAMETNHKPCGVVPQVHCPICKKESDFAKVRVKYTAKLLYLIPVMSMTQAAYVKCSCCNAAYVVDKKIIDRLSTPSEVHNAIMSEIQRRQERDGNRVEKYSNAGFSEKNQTLAVILACLFTSLGIPFFYIGKLLWGFLILAGLFVLAGLSRMGINVEGLIIAYSMLATFGGFALAILIAAGKVKDGKGKYIVSKNQKQAFMKR